MLLESLLAFFLGTVVCAIGAIPFGLVNLSVADISLHSGIKKAMIVAHGAAIVETLFGFLSILVGSFIMNLLTNHPVIQYGIAWIIGITGIFFLTGKEVSKNINHLKSNGLLKGAFLNLVSLQVLVFWLIAISFLISHQYFFVNKFFILFFMGGIWFGKLTVLWIYAKYSPLILNKTKVLSHNMNLIIGSVLIISSIFHIIK